MTLDGKKPLPPMGTAARHNRAMHRHFSGQPGDAQVVLTDPGIVYNLLPGQRVMISSMRCCVSTTNDTCDFDMVSCTEADGGGTPTSLCTPLYIRTPTPAAGDGTQQCGYAPEICVKHADGARSISVQTDAGDANVGIIVSWSGYWEADD